MMTAFYAVDLHLDRYDIRDYDTFKIFFISIEGYKK